jgi:hypothetical protein
MLLLYEWLSADGVVIGNAGDELITVVQGYILGTILSNFLLLLCLCLLSCNERDSNQTRADKGKDCGGPCCHCDCPAAKHWLPPVAGICILLLFPTVWSIIACIVWRPNSMSSPVWICAADDIISGATWSNIYQSCLGCGSVIGID